MADEFLGDYWVDRDEWGDRYIEHDVKGCHAKDNYWGSVLDAYEWAVAHHKVCPTVV